ncbi:MAG: 5-oxoprolinase, partial [Alphaproteobacteria bacterium]
MERQGERTALVTTKGFADALVIGDQRRPELFALNVAAPIVLFEKVVEVAERIGARGEVLRCPDMAAVKSDLTVLKQAGIKSIAIVFMHGDRYPDHETRVAALARKMGFPYVVTSHGTISVMKFNIRGSTTVVDAYLSPKLKDYVSGIENNTGNIPLYFMQSSGGLAGAKHFRGKDAILSGPAGGIVGAVKAAALDGFEKIIGFDMGGTSTDVAHYNGVFERSEEQDLGGIKLKVPSLKIHTVAAGGGSICSFHQGRFQVGPASAGANPGPACYRGGGPLTVTDCNLILGKLKPDLFPHVFGTGHNQPLDPEAALKKMADVVADIKKQAGKTISAKDAAKGFIAVAVEHMARAVKKISVQKGHNITKYTLVSFGGAGGQHACLVADALGVETILIHPLAGVLSALGIGQSGLIKVVEKTIEKPLGAKSLKATAAVLNNLKGEAIQSLKVQGAEPGAITAQFFLKVRFDGSDTPLTVGFGKMDAITAAFREAHESLFGFYEENKKLIIQSAVVETTTPSEDAIALPAPGKNAKTQKGPVFIRDDLSPGQVVSGPAVIVENHGTNIIEAGWQAEVSTTGNLILKRVEARQHHQLATAKPDPIMLEIFNNRFMTIAEEMGAILENTAHSVNIKERLDFSCALFDSTGDLVANAPHMPVHLGSMSESIKTIAGENKGKMKPGNTYLLNDPYHGGTHLPDLTVVLPVFLNRKDSDPDFFVAARGHHADIGGITPGSMPPNSKTIDEEGVLFTNFPLIIEGRFREDALRRQLVGAAFPARNPDQNVADIKAMVAACRRGITSLMVMCAEFGLDAVKNYMAFIQENAESAVREVIDVLENGSCSYPFDNGLEIKLAIRVDKKARSAEIDFTGTSGQASGNFNAPRAVTVAAVLYVFRCLVGQDIPLNAGCLKPLKLIVPKGCFLNPEFPAAVVAGNVETSQGTTNALLLALGKLAAAQGTMNNLTFGTEEWGYYETICGGSGAGPSFDGASAVHTHMTNTRITDPEVLERRYPVLLREFSIRRGSGGRGKHRGGDGITRAIEFLEAMSAGILSERRVTAPYGLNGGE